MFHCSVGEPQKKLFEVPYNFDETVLPFYRKYTDFISYLYLPPFKDDSINTRTSIQTSRKGYCYMPNTRMEYEQHLELIHQSGLRFVVLWQEPGRILEKKDLEYYNGLHASGFTIAQHKNAGIIKEYDPELTVIGSIALHLIEGITHFDYKNFDAVVLYYTFNRALNILKQLEHIREKIILIPNTFCHTDCRAIHHWFPKPDSVFDQFRDCPVLKDISKCSYISPEHLYLFDDFVGGYKIQGRENTTELLKVICSMYFNRIEPKGFLRAMLGDKLDKELRILEGNASPEEYYNVTTQDLVSII